MTVCSGCQFDNPDGMKFCGNCGASLAPAERGERERRQVTVLFSDLVGFTDFSVSVEDDDVPEVLDVYQNVVRKCVTRHGGHVAQFLGDGVLVYFGYPNALENGTEKAIQAALDIIEAIGVLGASGEFDQQVRIGIHQGSGVITRVAGEGRLLVGNTPNIASRMQSVAEPDTIVISEQTFNLVAGLFDCEFLGRKRIKGLKEELGIYVVKAYADLGRFEVEQKKGLGTFVGRQKEIEWLCHHVEAASSDNNKVLLLLGDAGMGKSRLLFELEERLSGTVNWVSYRCSEYRQSSPMQPIRELLRELIGITDYQPDTDQQALVGSFLAGAGIDGEDKRGLLSQFLLADSSEIVGETEIDSLLIEIARTGTRDSPLVIVLEDVHWVDQSTLGLLKKLSGARFEHGLVVIITSRPEIDRSRLLGLHCEELSLNQMDGPAIEQMLQERLDNRLIRASVVDFVASKSGGNPLYIEELIGALLKANVIREQGGQIQLDRTRTFRIPTTLHDSLAMHVDRLGRSRKVAQIASVLGSEFDAQLLRELVDDGEEFVDAAIAELQQRDILTAVDGADGARRFKFRHDLIRDVIYDSMVRQQREALHGRVARTIEEVRPAHREAHPDLLALHWHKAGEATLAIDYYRNACERFTAQGAHREALDHCRTALDLVRQEQPSARRDRTELDLLLMLAASTNSTDGYAVPEKFENVLVPALELCDKLELRHESAPIFYGIWNHQVARANKAKTEYWRDRLVNLTASENEPQPIHNEICARLTVGTTAFWEADFEQCLTAFNDISSRYSPQYHREMMRVFGEDLGVYAGLYRQWAYVFVGEIDKALAEVQASRELAASLQNPLNLVMTRAFAIHVSRDMGEIELTLERAEELIRLSELHGYTYYYVYANSQRSWALARMGREQEAIDTLGLNLKGHALMSPALVRDQVELFLASDDFKTALEWADAGIRLADQNLDILYKPEVLRVKGEALLGLGQEQEAEDTLREALACATELGEKYWAVKCADVLATLLMQKGSLEARPLLCNALDEVAGMGDCNVYRHARQTLASMTKD